MAKEKYTVGQVSDALRAARGVYMHAAQILDCQSDTIAGYVKRHPSLAKDVRVIDSDANDIVESLVWQTITGNATTTAEKKLQYRARIDWLEAKAKNRGWGRQHITLETPDEGFKVTFKGLPEKPRAAVRENGHVENGTRNGSQTSEV